MYKEMENLDRCSGLVADQKRAVCPSSLNKLGFLEERYEHCVLELASRLINSDQITSSNVYLHYSIAAWWNTNYILYNIIDSLYLTTLQHQHDMFHNLPSALYFHLYFPHETLIFPSYTHSNVPRKLSSIDLEDGLVLAPH